jgi:hypothetical protein
MEGQTQTAFGSYAPLAWGAVLGVTFGIFLGTLYLKKEPKR